MRSMPLIAVVAFAALPVGAQGLKIQGEARIESRAFRSDNASETDEASETIDTNLALFGRFDARFRQNGWASALRIVGRLDFVDEDRSLVFDEEAWVGYRRGNAEFRVGSRMLNWSATEAFHPADIMNSRNIDSDIERPEKLGEPMVSFDYRFSGGTLTAFLMPYRRAPEFPSPASRMNPAPPGWGFDDPIWVESDGSASRSAWSRQGGVRITKNLGPADVALHAVSHQDRFQPVLVARPERSALIPIFLPVLDTGATYLHVIDAWVVKAEFNHRNFDSPDHPVEIAAGNLVDVSRADHSQLALGIEWGWSLASGADATVFGEAQTILGVDRATRAELSIFQRDVLIGYRHSFNDEKGREFYATLIFDVERSRELLFNLRYRQRLSNTWAIEAGVRVFDAPTKNAIPQGLEFYGQSSHFLINLSRFF
jgi:hypothetical protein